MDSGLFMGKKIKNKISIDVWISLIKNRILAIYVNKFKNINFFLLQFDNMKNYEK